LGCLATSGHAGMEIQSGGCRIQNARIKKTRLFFEHNEFFMEWVIEEIKKAKRKAENAGYYFSVRLNGTSDIDWQNAKFKGYNLFEIFPDVQFYDYTKSHKKFEDKADNYHLTYSYTGRNWDKCKVLLEAGHNVAMVFNVRKETDLPSMYKGYKVVNGDLTDYRVADAKGIIVGLKWKRIANKQNEAQILQSCFVVNLPDVQGVNINPKYLQVA
jgi:pyruvate carboxylase